MSLQRRSRGWWVGLSLGLTACLPVDRDELDTTVNPGDGFQTPPVASPTPSGVSPTPAEHPPSPTQEPSPTLRPPTPSLAPSPTPSSPSPTASPTPTPTVPPDQDGDGYPPATDCDDQDPTVHPDAPDGCNGIDTNCNGLLDDEPDLAWYPDMDRDGYGDAQASPLVSCSSFTGMVHNNLDCNDGLASMNPSALEVCDTADNNCDGQIDEGVLQSYYLDQDTDGFGDPIYSEQGCTPSPDFTYNDQDCNDQDPLIHPGAPETCDEIDQDCDEDVIEAYPDQEADGIPDCSLPCEHYATELSATATLCGITLSEILLNGEDTAVWMPGGARLDLFFKYYIDGSDCTGCINQILVGYTEGTPTFCPYDKKTGSSPDSGKATGSFEVPVTPGVYYFRVDRSQDYSCPTTWWNCGGSPPVQFAAVCVY